MNWKKSSLLLVVVLITSAVISGLGLFADLAYSEGQMVSDCGPTLDAIPAEEENLGQSDVVDFVNLSEERQQEFEQAVTGNNPEIDSSDWDDTRFVQYENRTYETMVAVC